jgi:trehalose utilization protein
VQGIADHFILPQEEMYGEFFDVPEPEQTVLISSFSGGEVFRSGCCWTRGLGRIFYFRPGHETFSSYHDKNCLRIIENAVRWAAPALDEEAKPVDFGKHLEGWLDTKKTK